LPRWRGAAPIHRAIEAGDEESGITIMQMDESLDTGAMFSRQAVSITTEDTTGSLHDKLAILGGEMIVDTLQRLSHGSLEATPQPGEGVCYAAKISKEEAVLDFALPAEVLGRKIRAYHPFPGASGVFNDISLKIWRAEVVPSSLHGKPGEVLAADAERGVLVACGEGAIRLLELQKPGGKRLSAAEFIKGFALDGGRFQTSAT
jgi:methionyl-tRNA formyltransferase